MCTPDLELVSVSVRPVYLPREFGQVFVTCVYVHPKANDARAATTIADCVHRLQAVSPTAPNILVGDLNHCDLKRVLPDFEQFVTCTTRIDKTLDKCYCNIKGAYRSIQTPPIGSSDHNAVLLLPVYIQKLKREKVASRTIHTWSHDTEEKLKGCFACTDWNVLSESADVELSADVVTDYIKFCENMIVPKKVIKIFPNNKPWIPKRLKSKIIEKNKLFGEGREREGKMLQKEISRTIREEKKRLREKLETRFCGGGGCPGSLECIKNFGGEGGGEN
ncbi:hypothetical protein BaRGS_00010032 [Batillaria attramentaria]|uniref:Endonuclease/exonuclease/phosphatase domain-containing protein n=1 Tax=Batillaria attramentaria TaxID=370345 RepID=A0ABD0LH23_9CAEN